MAHTLCFLQVVLSDEKLAADVDLGSVASRTDGYSGSDLRQVCTAAAMRPIRELLRAKGKSAAQVGLLLHPQLCLLLLD